MTALVYDVAEMRHDQTTRPDSDDLVYRQNLGDLIRRARERRGLSQTDFGARLGVSKSTVIRWERGETSPTADLLTVIGRELGLTWGAFANPPTRSRVVAEDLEPYLAQDEAWLRERDETLSTHPRDDVPDTPDGSSHSHPARPNRRQGANG